MADTYLPYHRKYRPMSFAQMKGNEKMKKSIMAALREDRKPQVILMKGPAGTGKTTTARLLAQEYVCENRDPIVGACGKCYACEQMAHFIETGDTGDLMNVQEIDVTDSNKKQDIDALLDDAGIPAYDGGWKVYILDECHVLSAAAQNRLLKTLEEPAERVLMILCTTEPDKLLDTIVSRCQYEFKVTKPTRKEMCSLLAEVCIQEGVKYDNRGLSLVCVKGDFTPRKCLTALESVIREVGAVTYEDTLRVLEITSDSLFFEFYRYLTSKSINVPAYVAFLGKIKSSTGYKDFVDDLIQFTKRGIYVTNGVMVEALDNSELPAYKKLFNSFDPMDIAWLLAELTDMQKSRDVEARLILLGYVGIGQHSVPQASKEVEFAPTTVTTIAEKQEGERQHIKAITMTEEEREDIVSKYSKPVDLEDIARTFGAIKVDSAKLDTSGGSSGENPS